MTVRTIGLDIAKHAFRVHGADATGKVVLKKRLRREQVTDSFGRVSRCVVAMEATRGANYWARVIATFGHEVRLIAPQFVKPYVPGQKNDAQDAAAICEAASQPEIRFVPQKSVQQQDVQMLHRIRSRLVGNSAQLGNQIRGSLAGYGIIVPLHLTQLRKQLIELTTESHSQLTPFAQEFFASLYEEMRHIDEQLSQRSNVKLTQFNAGTIGLRSYKSSKRAAAPIFLGLPIAAAGWCADYTMDMRLYRVEASLSNAS